MLRRLGMFAVALIAVAAAFSSFDSKCEAMNRTGMSRQQIRATPLLDRPYRVGHIYGNTVRRANSR